MTKRAASGRRRPRREESPTTRTPEPPPSPTLRRRLDAVGVAVRVAVERDAELATNARQLVELAREIDAHPVKDTVDAFDATVDAVVARLQHDPELARLELADTVVSHFILAWVVQEVTGDTLPAPAEVRTRALPGIPTDAVSTLLTDADVETFKARLAPGQTWILANEIDHRVWPQIAGLVQYQRRMLGLPFGRPGRRPGSRSPEREALIDEICVAMRAGRPLSNRTIERRAREAGVWASGVAEDYTATRKRVASLRRAATRKLAAQSNT